MPTDGSNQSTRSAFAECVPELALKHNAVIVDTDTGTLRPGSVNEHVINVGIAECTAISVASGISHSGRPSIVLGFAAFITGRAYEFIKIDVAYARRNVVIVGTHGGLSSGWLGPTHHSLEDLNLMAGLPNMRVVIPADATRVRNWVNVLLASEGPAYIRLGRKDSPVLKSETGWSKTGWTVLEEGTGGALVAVGPELIRVAIKARELLLEDGYHVSVIAVEDFSTVPSFCDYIKTQDPTPIIVLEESWFPGVLTPTIREHILTKSRIVGMTVSGFQSASSHETLYTRSNFTPEGVRNFFIENNVLEPYRKEVL